MCGIACYIGQKRPITFLINALKKLEYRGYDSAGDASVEEEKINVIKSCGSIKSLDPSKFDTQ